MKTWFARFKVSASLDRLGNKDVPPRPASLRDPQVEVFEKRLASLDRALQGGPMRAAPPAVLHGSIMTAVRACQAPTSSAGHFHAFRWALASAVVLLLAAGVWVSSTRLLSRIAPSPFGSSASIQLNQRVAALPSTVLSPLSEEWESLNKDLHKTAEFLVASIP